MGHGTVRYLKRLVTALTLTTIVGLVVLVGVVVMRFSQTTPQQSCSRRPARPNRFAGWRERRRCDLWPRLDRNRVGQ